MEPLPSSRDLGTGERQLVNAFRDVMVTVASHAVIELGPDTAERNGHGPGTAERNGSNTAAARENGAAASHGSVAVERRGGDLVARDGSADARHNGTITLERNGFGSVEAAGAAVLEREPQQVTERRQQRGDQRAGGGRRGNISAIRVSVVIPALNEALNLRHVLANLPDNVFEVVLVPGHSTDDTEEVARSLRPDVRVIHQTRSGKGNALACGFAACRGDIIVTLDADGSADPKEIPAFVGALVSGADFAKGTRAIQGGGSHDMTLLRRLGNRGLTHLANVLHGTHYSDLCYGYNAFWHACLPALNVDIDGFEVETLLNLRAAKSGLRVTEVASFELARIHGRSNLRTFNDGWRVLGTILREWVPKHHRVPHTPPSRLEAGRRRAARRAEPADPAGARE